MERFDQIESELSNIKLINKGGQKIVYFAIHPKYGSIAYKKVNKMNDETRKRMLREAKILQELNHTSFPKIYEIAISSDNSQCVIIEEFIDGTTLRKIMRNYYSPCNALSLLKELTEILSIIWDKRIVHRDLKPENILVNKNNEIKIIDFGCARDLNDTTITKEGGAPLTKIYAAPEQIQYNKNNISWRTDQFALGIITGELLYKGIHPFDYRLTGETDLVYAILHNKWCRNQFLEHTNVLNLFERLLSVQPHSRYPNTIEMLNAINLAKGDYQ